MLMLDLGLQAETPGVTHFGAYHRPPDGHFWLFQAIKCLKSQKSLTDSLLGDAVASKKENNCRHMSAVKGLPQDIMKKTSRKLFSLQPLFFCSVFPPLQVIHSKSDVPIYEV